MAKARMRMRVLPYRVSGESEYILIGMRDFQAGDVWGGLAAMLVALPSSIAFGVLVFSAANPAFSAQGAWYGMLGAAVLGLVAPLVGGTRALISAPCAPAAAILAGLAGL